MKRHWLRSMTGLLLLCSLAHANKPGLDSVVPRSPLISPEPQQLLCPQLDYPKPLRYRSLDASIWRQQQSQQCRLFELEDFALEVDRDGLFSMFVPRSNWRHYRGHKAQPETATEETVYQKQQLAIVRGYRTSGDTLSLWRGPEWWFMRDADLRALGLPVGDTPTLLRNGENYRALTSLSALGLSIDTTWGLLFVGDRAASTGVDEAALSDAWLEVNVNQSGEPQLAVALLDADGRAYVGADVIEHFRLRNDGVQTVERYGETYYALASIPGARSVYNEREQSVMVYASSDSFLSTETSARRSQYVQADFNQRGALMNYALFGSSSDEDDSLSGQLELGLFAGRGFFANQWLFQDAGGATHNAVRLDTGVRFDWPSKLRSLRLGDTISFSGSLGNAVRYGGVQWGTDFSTQPGFITFPTPAILGEAIVPSTVDVYIDNVRRASETVPPGPYTITNVPVVTGSGNMRLVIRDMFGREQVITQPFYSSRGLLKPGLHEYVYEGGTLREDFGQVSYEYGRGFIAGTHRYGFTPQLTGELHGEGMRDQVTLGGAANWLWPEVGEFSLALAGSHHDPTGDNGYFQELGYQRQSRSLSYGAVVSATSRHFVRLGQSAEPPPDASQLRGFVSYTLGERGALTLSYSRLDRRQAEDLEFATFQYTVNVGSRAHLRLNLFEPLVQDLGRIVGLSFAIPLGGTALQLNASDQDSGTTVGAQWQRNAPSGPGWGYRLLAEDGPVDRFEVDSQWRTERLAVLAQAAEVNQLREYRLSAEGGVAFMDNRAYWSRRLDQAFAIVEVPGMADVDIYRDNRLLARTDELGTAIVPGLRDYQRNLLSVGDADLPLDIEVSSLEKTVVPAYRRGLRLKFDISRSNWVSFTLTTDAGTAIPAGVELRDTETGESFAMGLEGQVYLQAQTGPHKYELNWSGQRCTVAVTIPGGELLFPDLGEQVCQMQQRQPEAAP